MAQNVASSLAKAAVAETIGAPKARAAISAMREVLMIPPQEWCVRGLDAAEVPAVPSWQVEGSNLARKAFTAPPHPRCPAVCRDP